MKSSHIFKMELNRFTNNVSSPFKDMGGLHYMSIIKQKHFMPRFYLGYGFIAEDGAKLDWEFSEVKSERFNVEYLSLSEHEAILSEERARLSELEKKFEKRLTGVIYELYAKEKSKEEFNALIDSALAKLKAKSSVGDEGDK